MPKIKKVLIANRAEIAVRIIRTCKEMNIKTVAVYSEADRLSPHVLMADEAFCIGPARASESYLDKDKLLKVAHQTKADAIHPGYGFLAENADFAQKVQKEKLIFIGPNPDTIRLMGSKTESRKNMIAAGVPVVPGSQEPIKSLKHAKSIIADMGGYPVLIKAASGGGGKGMRVVRSAADLERAMQASKSESEKAFSDATIYIEKFLESSKHIEMQIFADSHGNCIHLRERDCSVQRRHQKIIEESPSPVLTAEKREAMGEIATQAARACKYLGAGTVEFLYDTDSNFYFLEMNTRLQVEHPVTEMLLGLDLVKLQILVAEGKPLPIKQSDLKPRGHTIECRIYAENAQNKFLPSTGKVTFLRHPEGPGTRVDSGIMKGNEISLFYDPLISKLITWGENRTQCIARMRRALNEYKIIGVQSTIAFCEKVLNHPLYLKGSYDTHFVDTHLPEIMEQDLPDEKIAQLAALAIAFKKATGTKAYSSADGVMQHSNAISKWKARGTRERLSQK
jgi:propionyl-CoA carboxylase alpha chain